MPRPDHHVRRVILPSGKTIEVVYFEDLDPETPDPAPAEPATSTEDAAADLHQCGTCGSNLVYPTDWSEVGTRHWQVELRCPNCEWTGTGVFEQELVDRFDKELDLATESLVQDLNRLMRSNAEDEIEAFRVALARDLIVPEDF